MMYSAKNYFLYKTQFENAPEPEPVINTVLKIVRNKDPKYSYPVGKGSSMILTVQRFAYSIFENSIKYKE